MDPDAKAEIDDLRETVQSLRERVSTLEGRLDSTDTETATSAALDRYDKEAKRILDSDVATANPREVMKAYEMAGIVNQKKQKTRAKRLKRLEGGAE